MKRAARFVALLCATMLSACSAGPDYEAPEASSLVPESWTEPSGNALDSDLDLWWTQLGDAELTGLIGRAFASSLTLAEAGERVVSARARRGIANAERLPAVDASASYARAQTGEEGLNFAGPPAGSEIDIYSLGVVAGWEVDLWGRVGRLVEAADAEIEVAIEDLRASRVALAAEVAREVVLIRAIDREITLIETTVATSGDALAIAEARSLAGLGDELDVARARRDLDANLALLPALHADRRGAEFRLAVLVGEAPGSVTVGVADLPARDVVPALGVPADLLLRRPDLRRAERALAAATARIGAAKAEWYPRVTLSGSIALQGPDPADTINPDAYALSVGPSITIPVFEGGRIRSRVQQVESAQREALLRLRSTVLAALSEVETATMRRQRAEERAARLGSAEAAALDAERLAMDRYTAGQADFLEVTEARQGRLAIERTRTLAERDALLRLIDLYTALGGGWQREPMPPGDERAAVPEASAAPTPTS